MNDIVPPNVTVSAVFAATTVTVPVSVFASREIGPSLAVLYDVVLREMPPSAKSLSPERVIVKTEAAGVSTVTTPSDVDAVTRSIVESDTPATVAPSDPSFVKVITTSFATSSTPAAGMIATHVPKSMSDMSSTVIALVRVIDALTVAVCANELLVMAKPSDTALANAKSFRVLRLIRFLLIFPRLRYCYSVYEWDKILILSKWSR